MNMRFLDKFHSHWIKVKFYEEKPNSIGAKKLSGVRFCEAVDRALIGPIILDEECISCPGANYVFNWGNPNRKEIIDFWQDTVKISEDIAGTILDSVPRLKKSYEYIGLNTNDEPDLLLAYLTPEESMDLLKIYHNYTGEILNFSLSSIMTICGNIVVDTFMKEKINISFGCDKARKYGKIAREKLAVGIPRKLFDIFIP